MCAGRAAIHGRIDFLDQIFLRNSGAVIDAQIVDGTLAGESAGDADQRIRTYRQDGERVVTVVGIIAIRAAVIRDGHSAAGDRAGPRDTHDNRIRSCRGREEGPGADITAAAVSTNVEIVGHTSDQFGNCVWIVFYTRDGDSIFGVLDIKTGRTINDVPEFTLLVHPREVNRVACRGRSRYVDRRGTARSVVHNNIVKIDVGIAGTIVTGGLEDDYHSGGIRQVRERISGRSPGGSAG